MSAYSVDSRLSTSSGRTTLSFEKLVAYQKAVDFADPLAYQEKYSGQSIILLPASTSEMNSAPPG